MNPSLRPPATPVGSFGPTMSVMFGILTAMSVLTSVHAGDILRRGSTQAPPRAAPTGTGGSSPMTGAASTAKINANDRLARTTQALQAVRDMQSAARAAAQVGPNSLGRGLPNVPNGLAVGGLQVDPQVATNPGLWKGAHLPTQSVSNGQVNVGITQTAPQALLNWRTFNIGKSTTLNFNQSAGGSQASQWIAFNKINDPTGVPSQILGSIKAPGQVYIINPNGIIFGGSSQINTRALVASSLPINDNLIERGLLNNPDAQFLFSGLTVPGGSDGTPDFNPAPPPTPNGRYGDVVVQPGATIASPVSADGNGGRVMLVGPNVRNEGTISTPSGQTILAAGLQVAIQAHDGQDPSLRGLDVFIGSVGDYAGTATNSGLIEAQTGSILMAGREINQLGVLESSTSVNLNGRIDLLASYGAVANPNYDAATGDGAGGPAFLYQHTGAVQLGGGSVTRILPDYASTASIPGTSLPEKSQINMEGLAVNFGPGSILLAPNADIRVRAGIWPYKDPDGNRTVLTPAGAVEPGLISFYSGTTQRFLFAGGQIYLDPGALIDASGSTDVFVPLANNLVTVELRGFELADSPVQRDRGLRGTPLTVDLRRTGTFFGQEWVGTPLGNLTALAGTIQRTAGQLTAAGGTIAMQAGGSIVIQPGATVDVSGGFYRHEGGDIQTTRLLLGSNIIDVADATPDMIYRGIYDGTFTVESPKWGFFQTFRHPLQSDTQGEYVEGAAGGKINLTAPSMVIGGELAGHTVEGPRQLDSPPELSSLSLSFTGEKSLALTATDTRFLPIAPTPPRLVLTEEKVRSAAGPFALVDGEPVEISPSLQDQFLLSTTLYKDGGFGHITIDNRDGDVLIPNGVDVVTPAGGSLTVAAANVSVAGNITAPGGAISLTAYNFSPFEYQELVARDVFASSPQPSPQLGRGIVSLAPTSILSTAGLVLDDRPTSPTAFTQPRILDGGSIKIEAYSAELPAGSVLDASGGVWATVDGDFEFGKGGDISILTGKDPAIPALIGGKLDLGADLRSYSGTEGGSLAVQASLVQVGGQATAPNTLVLQPDFFQRGGFTSYSLTGIGARVEDTGEYIPAVRIAAGTTVNPVADTWHVTPYREEDGALELNPMRMQAGLRPPSSVELAALGADDNFTIDVLEARGDIVIEDGARIITDPGASVKVDGDTVAILGSIEAPGGQIEISGGREFKLPDPSAPPSYALPTTYLGPNAKLSTAGTTVSLPDPFGRRVGVLYDGGTITVSGNIVASAGATLDVSGASTIFDVHPSRLSEDSPLADIPAAHGVTGKLWARRTVPVRLDSNGGTITLEGSEMLFSDATLLGKAGGPAALGGTLAVSSGRFYAEGALRTGADINLEVRQSGLSIAGTNHELGVGIPVLDAAGSVLRGMGYFSVDRFSQGGFDSLDLGFNYNEDASPIRYGGNVRFVGPVTIQAAGALRVAGGGVIESDSPVTLSAPYIAIGQEFRPPLHPDDPDYVPFLQVLPSGSTSQFFLTPAFGPGSLTVSANLIDVGTLSLQKIGKAHLMAAGGDIRGNGTVDIAGDLTLTAAQIYPTTLATFNLIAHDHTAGAAAVPGSVTIVESGTAAPPLSAGGSLNIFASVINQGGVLRAPLGTITLGYDGTDLDPSDADIDRPANPVANAIPVASTVTLQTGSLTSVAALGPNDEPLLIPFGLSEDGLTWTDPRGANVTVSGLPAKRVSVAGDTVVAQQGSVIDIRGGGDLFAYRWESGNGGSMDILGTGAQEWSAGNEYAAGDLVLYEGRTWSARTAINPDDFALNAPAPEVGRFWSLVPESYAVLPGFGSGFSPYAAFNTTGQSNLKDPGYVSAGLRIGDQIYLDETAGLPAGTYTLLPRRYALLPGAYLVTPQEGDARSAATLAEPLLTYKTPEGARYGAGYRLNGLNTSAPLSPIATQFEVASSDVIQGRPGADARYGGRADYELYHASSFITEAAKRLDIATPQLLPIDAGAASFHGNSGLQLQGDLRTAPGPNGRGATVDISSFGDIFIVGGRGSAPAGASTVLNADLLTSWGAESLLIGGIRRSTSTGHEIIARSSNVTLNNPGGSFSAPEILLVSKEALTLAPGSSIASSGPVTGSADSLSINGDGALVRVSGHSSATVTRSSLTGSTAPILTIGAGASISGPGIILDSSYATALDPAARISAQALTLGSGQISIVFDDASGVLTGAAFAPHLVLEGAFLQQLQQVGSLTLQSYRTIDIYGTGTFGSRGSLNLLGGGLRGFEQGAGSVVFQGDSILLDNPSDVAALAAPLAPLSGELRFDAEVVRFGTNDFSVTGYENLAINASAGVIGIGEGAFSTPGNLTVTAPLITGEQGSTHAVTAGGALRLESAAGTSRLASGLGASFTFTGTEVAANTSILLPSGQLTLHALTGDVTVGGHISVEGTSQVFSDLIRYSDAGNITLSSDLGNVSLLAGSSLSVAAAPAGGNAGTLSVNTPNGAFMGDGTLTGRAAAGYATGSFLLDVGTMPLLSDVAAPLADGGFFENIGIRVRSGDVTVDGTTVARRFSLSADQGGITVTGTLDASGVTGGEIILVARDNLTLAPTAVLTAAAQEFSNAGKGGHIRLEAGASSNGAVNTAAMLDIQSGSVIDLSVAEFVPGDFATPGSSAFFGQFTGTLHLRAPRNGNDVNVNSIEGSILGASSVIVEGYRLYQPAGGNLDTTLRTTINTDAANFMNAGYAAMQAKLLAGNPDAAGLDSVLVIAPGVEIINPAGDLTLGTPNLANGNATSSTTADWDLSSFRYGPKGAPGILTLRASGDLVFNNTLSDGFTPVAANAASGFSTMWLAPLMTINSALPTNTQSWSYRLAAGADLNAADFREVLPAGQLAAGKGSLLVGEFYPAVPNAASTGTTAAVGSSGTTANTIRIGNTLAAGTRYEVIRTGTGDIDVSVGRDIQLRNQFATIYTAGVRLPTPTTVYAAGDFIVPIVVRSGTQHPSQGNLGAIQQNYAPQWSMAGGSLTLQAQENIGRFTMHNGSLVVDSSRQMPNNWLYRRGYVDPETGLFADDGGVDGTSPFQTITDTAASTTWWIDFSNFFEGFGALGGGNVTLLAGNDIINADAVIPTNARMPGRDPLTGANVAPDADRLLEHGGGDLIVRAGRNIDGGVYYVERGHGSLVAGGEITTNQARSPSLGILGSSSLPTSLDPIIVSRTPEIYDPSTWLPTTLFVGKSHFDVTARGDVLLGPVTNPFLLPQGLNNKFWYKTYFNTFSEDAGVSAVSLGGDVTHRLAVTLPSTGGTASVPILDAWLNKQNQFAGVTSSNNASHYQPWLRLAEQSISSFNTTILSLAAPNVRSTAFAGDINVIGDMTLFPSATGTLELASTGSITGLQSSGLSLVNNRVTTVFTYSSLNVSDANPTSAPGISSPLAYTALVGRALIPSQGSATDPFTTINPLFQETGSFAGEAGTIEVKQALHAPNLLHAGDPEPVRLYASAGDITGLTLFSPKAARVSAGNDITDASFYIQNVAETDISLVSAGRDIIPFNENAPVRATATDPAQGNILGEPTRATVAGTGTNAQAGDIQISGPGVLEVLAGRNLDLGTGPNFTDGTGVGLTSIGKSRNSFLPVEGARIIALAGVGGENGGAADGLLGSVLDFAGFISDYLGAGGETPAGIDLAGGTQDFASLSPEHQSIVALDVFFGLLSQAGSEHATTGSYDLGFAAIDSLFGSGPYEGEILTRARDIRTTSGGAITLAAPGGGLAMASSIFGNPLAPPGIVTEFGGPVSIFTNGSVDIGQARIFTLRGGDLTIWSSQGDIAAGTAPKTVVTAPPTRVVVDATSADIQTDLGGLATGGGIGVLASVKGVEPGNVALIAPSGTIDAGDAGIRATGNITIAAVTVLNADNIAAAGATVGAPTSAPVAAAPNIGSLTTAANTAGAATTAGNEVANQTPSEAQTQPQEQTPSLITVQVLGYGGGSDDEEDDEEEKPQEQREANNNSGQTAGDDRGPI